MKQQLQAMLSRVGVYQRLKSSIVYDLYWSLANRQLIVDRAREVEFYRSLLQGLRPRDLIFDVGANRGTKVDIFLRLGARVVAVEPDEHNQQVLRERFVKLRIRPKSVKLVGAALSEESGVETMWIDEPGSAKNTLSKKWAATLQTDERRFGHKLDFATRKQVVTTTLEELIRRHGRPFFIKIDVEGFEPRVLRGLQSPVRYISFEVNLPEFRPEGLECIQLLANISPRGRFNYSTEIQQGLAMVGWLGARDFETAFNSCEAESIEVFWNSEPQ